MSWIEPVTERGESARMTADDMNRITGNIKYIYPDTTIKTVWTSNDFITAENWSSIFTALNYLVSSTGNIYQIPKVELTYQNINDIETLILNLKNRLSLISAQEVANIYPSNLTDEIYSNETAENYIRGV